MKRLRALAAPLLRATAAAQAGVRLDIGVVVPVLPYGAVSVGVGHGPYGGYGGYGGHPYWRHGGWWYRPWGAQFIVVPAPVIVAPRPVREAPEPRSVGPTLPDPVITARQGQDPNQTEYDRQRCNRWAVTQPAALADAAEFQRTVARCLDGLGYTMK